MRASSLTYEKRALKIDSSTTLVPGSVQRKRHHLRLQVGREAGIRRGENVGAAGDPRGLHADPILARGHLDAALDEFVEQGVQVVRAAARHGDVAARRAPRQQQRSGDDAVGDDLVLDAVQLGDAVDDERVGTVPGDLRAHRPRKFARSTTSGSIAAFLSVVVPSAKTAASIAFFVAPTLGMRNSIVAPRSEPAFDCAMR